MLHVIPDLDDERNLWPTPTSNDVPDWKCRECGFVNRDSCTVCETCETHKPMHPRLETRPSYTERPSSASSSDRRSPSPETENAIDREHSPDLSSIHRRNSSIEGSSSEPDMSDNDQPSDYASTGSKGGQKSSYSPHDHQRHSPRNATKQRSSSKGKYSIEIDLKLLNGLLFPSSMTCD